jgi:hypothetical protein
VAAKEYLSHPLGHVNLIPNFKVWDGHKGNACFASRACDVMAVTMELIAQSALDGIAKRFDDSLRVGFDRLTQNCIVSSFDV